MVSGTVSLLYHLIRDQHKTNLIFQGLIIVVDEGWSPTPQLSMAVIPYAQCSVRDSLKKG